MKRKIPIIEEDEEPEEEEEIEEPALPPRKVRPTNPPIDEDAIRERVIKEVLSMISTKNIQEEPPEPKMIIPPKEARPRMYQQPFTEIPAAPPRVPPPAPPKPLPDDSSWAFDEKGSKKTRLFNRYPIIAILLESRSGGGTYAFFDRIGRFKKKIGLGFEYRLKYKKKRLPTSQFENIIESNKGRLIIIDHPEEDVFNPIKISGSTISPKETAWKEIFMNNVERAHILLTRKGFMEKYMPLILLLVFGMFMIMALYIVRTDLAMIADQVKSSFSAAVGAMSAAKPPL